MTNATAYVPHRLPRKGAPVELVQLYDEYQRLSEEWLTGACSLKRLNIIHERLRKARALWAVEVTR